MENLMTTPQILESEVSEGEKTVNETVELRKTIRALAYALEAKDKYTSCHSQRVSDMSGAIARELGLPEDAVEKIVLAALVHDIGKIGVRECVLNKPGRLTDEELQHIQQHPETGQHILSPVVEDKDILMCVRYHHRRYDGGGYPEISKDDKIPLGAKILAIADAYEAMTSDRPYRKAMSYGAACAEIERSKRTQFDPEIADAFLRTEYGHVASISVSTRCQEM